MMFINGGLTLNWGELNYVMDNPCDSAGPMALRAHRARRRILNPLAAGGCSDRAHH